MDVSLAEKMVIFCSKMFFMKLNIKDEGHLYPSSLKKHSF